MTFDLGVTTTEEVLPILTVFIRYWSFLRLILAGEKFPLTNDRLGGLTGLTLDRGYYGPYRKSHF